MASPAGRPAISDAQKRKNIIRPSFTDAEYLAIESLSRDTGEAPAAFVRRLVVPVISNKLNQRS